MARLIDTDTQLYADFRAWLKHRDEIPSVAKWVVVELLKVR